MARIAAFICFAMLMAIAFSGCIAENGGIIGAKPLPKESKTAVQPGQSSANGTSNESNSESNNMSVPDIPDKWAILGADGYENAEGDDLSGDWMVPDTMVVYECLLQMGFPESHIILCLNENFTKKNISWALDYVNSHAANPNNATIAIRMQSHGASTPGLGGVDMTGGTPFHSCIQIRKNGSKNRAPAWDMLWDYELDAMLDKHTFEKLFVSISSCENGYYAGQDTTGMLGGTLDSMYTACSGPGRVIIVDSTAPLMSYGSLECYALWEEGLLGGKGDSAPIFGNGDGKTSAEEAFFYFKTKIDPTVQIEQPCMNDQYEGEMFL